MLISVVIPTYRRTQLLQKCLEALCRQRFLPADFETIVVTDGPDEATAEMVRRTAVQYPFHTVRCIHTPEKRGPAAARNGGWQAATGKLVVFTDDDTLPDENCLVSYWKAYQQAGKKAIAFSGKTVVPLPEYPTDYEKNTAGLETAEFITANCACSVAALQKTGGFDEQFTMAWREDSDLQFRLLVSQVPVYKAEGAIVVHPVRQAPWGISIREQKKGMFNALLYKKHPHLYTQKIGTRPVWNYYAMIGFVLAGLVFICMQWWLAATVAYALWLCLVLHFARKRLKKASKKWRHISEMVYTSAVIPFLSIYWTWYGAMRFKKFLM